MIKLQVLDNESNHFVVRGDEPFRIEIMTDSSGRVQAMVYQGSKDNPDQEPVGVFDGDIENKDWIEE